MLSSKPLSTAKVTTTMNNFAHWFFDGLGTEIVRFLIGVICAGILGFRIGKRSRLSQTQRASDGAKQSQYGRSENVNHVNKDSTDHSDIIQTQSAGDSSEQIQVGGSKNV